MDGRVPRLILTSSPGGQEEGGGIALRPFAAKKEKGTEETKLPKRTGKKEPFPHVPSYSSLVIDGGLLPRDLASLGPFMTPAHIGGGGPATYVTFFVVYVSATASFSWPRIW